jgi:DNA-binding Lrp family transcriptional regulator
MSRQEPVEASLRGRLAELDDLDRDIVDVLQGDGRISIRALAAQLNISRAAGYTRVERLHRTGVITGYSATIDPERYGHGVSAYVYLKIRQHSWKSVRERLHKIPQIEHGALVSGENDLVLLVRTRDTGALRDFVLDTLQAMPDVLSTQTVLIFAELPRPLRPSAARSGGPWAVSP